MAIEARLVVGSMKELRANTTTEAEKLGPLKQGMEVYVTITSGKPDTGAWGMTKLFRKWSAIVGEFMADNGITQPLMVKDGKPWGTRPFNAQDAYELFTVRAMGLAPNGKRYSWSKSGEDGRTPADHGQRYFAIQEIEKWALEKGLSLPRPPNSEYEKYEREQNR